MAGATTDNLVQQGYQLHLAGRLDEARTLYKRALQRDARHFHALQLLGAVCLDTGQPELGLSLIGRAVAIDPTMAAAHNNLAKGLSDLGRHEEAVRRCDTAISLQPVFPAAHNNRAAALVELARFEEALASGDIAIAQSPDFAEAYHNRGAALRGLGRLEEALVSLDRAVALKPAYADGFASRGALLSRMGRDEESLASFETAIALAPTSAKTWNNHGLTLLKMGRVQEALAAVDRALVLAPGSVGALNNQGLSLEAAGRYDEALKSYARALELDPDHAEATLNAALVRLRLGDFSGAWPGYEARRRVSVGEPHHHDEGRLWRGEADLAGRRLFVYHEQGLGDTIQFARYVPLLRASGVEVVLSAQTALRDLLRPLTPDAAVLGTGEAPPAFDYHCPLPGLARAFATTVETIPGPPHYLAADPERRAALEAQLPAAGRLRVGLAWSGNPDHRDDRNRSIALATLRPLLSAPADFICVQRDVRPADAATMREDGRIASLAGALNDFGDTAALVDALDLVISVDTSIAHLAGALGKPVWILLPFNPDWRWGLGRDDSPWYPSARLFRQPAPGAWDTAVEAVRVALGGLIADGAGGGRR